LDHNKSTSLLTKDVDDIIKGVGKNKEYDVEASCSKCYSRLLNEEKW
jgi:hypothetical protein